MAAPTSLFTLDVRLGEDAFSASGKPDLVLKAFEDFKALTGHIGDGPQPTTSAKRAPRERHIKTPHGEVLLQEFLAKLKLKGNAQVGAAILSWATQHGEKDKLTTLELHELWEQTEHKAPTPASNVTRDLGPAIKKGWVKKEGKGKGQTFHAQAYGQKEVAKLAAASED
jgi:hypothetical protein